MIDSRGAWVVGAAMLVACGAHPAPSAAPAPSSSATPPPPPPVVRAEVEPDGDVPIVGFTTPPARCPRGTSVARTPAEIARVTGSRAPEVAKDTVRGRDWRAIDLEREMVLVACVGEADDHTQITIERVRRVNGRIIASYRVHVQHRGVPPSPSWPATAVVISKSASPVTFEELESTQSEPLP